MRNKQALVVAVWLLAPGGGAAQDPTDAAAPAASTPEAAAEQPPPGEPVAAPTPPAGSSPAPESAPEASQPEAFAESQGEFGDLGFEPFEAAPAEEEEGTFGWFRIDTDARSTHLWVGAAHALGGVDLASDIRVYGTVAQLDVGIAFAVGPIALLPMVGLIFDFGEQSFVGPVAPQLFTVIELGPIYFESWAQAFIRSPSGGGNTFYTRNFLLLQASDAFGVGPQLELTSPLDDTAKVLEVDEDGDPTRLSSGLRSLQLGGRLNIGYGENNTLGLFLGAELDRDGKAGGDDLVGRFTFIRTW